MKQIFENITYLLGAWCGYLVGEFAPSFPLLVVATLFVVYDAWAAYELDKRVHVMYPNRVQRDKAYFESFKFRKVINTLIERMVVILLAFCAERWVFIHVSLPLSYIIAGLVCAEQTLSIAENKASCRLPGDRHARFWKLLAKVLVDKTARHFDFDASELQQEIDKIGDGENGNVSK